MKNYFLGAILLLACTYANAALILNVEGISGSGSTTWSLSGSSTVNQSGTIRTNVGSNNFSVDDTFEPDVAGDFISSTTTILDNSLFSISGLATITIGSDTQTITDIFLDPDGASRDDFGIRVDSALSYLAGEASSWAGDFVVGLDISEFNLGTYRLNTTQSNGGGFLFALADDVVLNFNEATSVPEPSVIALLSLGLAGIGFSRKKKAA
ncbi:MAG: PEP-CTERM sorting domain-containing protein [Pseudomonadales bacterium]|uniref:Ice-binding protein C-terminal domain-containing protein n=1 Tax=Oleiphilus messinensis TaxID=141451 RepID=A0A1Y0I681_9GAMM|nr:PEP-CTERM sorting domain-containing protein [Oleiphilus messinensis]ARU55740.1 hypothetical protein OLMES_1665 [Oleiphilus messinensis]MCG8610417.1 PEP-CTERM sorting domain-containing protein [Pseudomonadales bacterium]